VSVLTGPAALRRHGLSGHQWGRELASYRRNTVVDVLVPAVSQRADAGFARLHRTARLPELICASGGARFALPPRAVADAVRSMANLSDVRAVVAEAVQRNRCSVSQLAEELTCGPIRGSALLRQALAEVREGIRSSAEGDLHDLIVWARLPAPMFNPRLMVGKDFLAIPDCWWPESGVAAEADSRAWHLSPADWENTMARHARMSAQGIIILHFSPAQIRTERKDVASTIRKALAAGRAGRCPISGPFRPLDPSVVVTATTTAHPLARHRPVVLVVVATSTKECRRCHNHDKGKPERPSRQSHLPQEPLW
jgi:hypothetical protein